MKSYVVYAANDDLKFENPSNMVQSAPQYKWIIYGYQYWCADISFDKILVLKCIQCTLIVFINARELIIINW